jgi:hypothetical protein
LTSIAALVFYFFSKKVKITALYWVVHYLTKISGFPQLFVRKRHFKEPTVKIPDSVKNIRIPPDRNLYQQHSVRIWIQKTACKSASLFSQKLMKETVWRAKRLTREMQVRTGAKLHTTAATPAMIL